MELSRWLYQVGHGQRLHRAGCGILRATARRGSPESTVRLCRICVGNLDGGEELYVEAWCAHTDLRCSDIIGSKATPFRQCLQCRAMAISTREIDRAQLGAVQEDPLPVQEAAEDVPVRNELQVAVELEEPRGPACPALSAVAAPVIAEELLGWEVISASSAGPRASEASGPRAVPEARAVQRARSAGQVDLQGSPTATP